MQDQPRSSAVQRFLGVMGVLALVVAVPVTGMAWSEERRAGVLALSQVCASWAQVAAVCVAGAGVIGAVRNRGGPG